MIDGLKPYPEYKESGVPWLGRVPAKWKVSRIKTVLRELDCRSPDGTGTLLSLTRLRGLIPHRIMTDKAHSARTLSGYKRYRPGQIVMNRMQAWSGMFGTGLIEGLVSPDYAVFEILGGHAVRLILERLKTPDLIGQFALESKGIGSGFNRLYTDRFGPIPITLPPREEQAAIVRFLDHAGGRVERAIRAKKKLIALLHEQKQAIIHRAVTRGLDPNVPLKPSGIPWLGDVPQHWEVRPFVRCSTERADYRGATPEKMESGVFLVTAKNIRKGWIDYESSKEYVRAADYSKIMRRGLPRIGDVVLTTEAPLGNVALVDREDVAMAQRIIRFRLDQRRLLPSFALLSLTSPYFQNQLALRATGSTAQGIKASKLPQLLVALPSTDEQKATIAYVATVTEPLNEAIARTEREIALLREYRTRLIADVVTGKLDVREAARHLPAEAVEESASLSADVPPDDVLEPEAAGEE